jgi:uncharacterized protein (TIGR03437 family)
VAAIVSSSVSGETAQLTRDFSGPGPAAARNEDGSTNTHANPAKAGQGISLFATGLGRSGSQVSVKIGADIAPAISVEIQSAGVAQVRVRIPDRVRAGAEVAVNLQAGNASSPEVTLAVK